MTKKKVEKPLPAIADRRSGSDAFLRKAALTFLELGRRHADELRRAGFTPADHERLSQALAAFDEACGARQVASQRMGQAAVVVNELAAEAKTFRRQVIAAFKLLAKRGLPVGRRTLLVGRPAETPERLLAWMAEMRQSVEALQKPLGACLDDALPGLDSLHARLTSALGELQANRRSGPAATTLVAQSRTEILESMDEMHLAAQIAFHARREVMREFKKRVYRSSRSVRAILRTQPAANDATASVA